MREIEEVLRRRPDLGTLVGETQALRTRLATERRSGGHEAFVEDQAGLRLGQAGELALDPKTAALLQLGVSVAIGSPAVCIEWSAPHHGAQPGSQFIRIG